MSTEAVRRTRRALLAFYDARRRELPWRRRAPGRGGAGPEPYQVWISEVMLQQTRVEAVVPYYQSWMERFPDVDALAAAPLDDVLRAWEGLGYYSRARNLHRAARVVRDGMAGALPSTAAALRELPGVGEYTAGAIASIAFGAAVPAVDGNVRRVLARLFDEPEPSAAWLRELASGLVDPRRPGDFNQALMELGATVCTPRAPTCADCPVAADCRALRRGTVGERPRPRGRAAIRDVEYGVAVIVRRGRGGAEVLLAKRPPDGLLGGLWELPTRAVSGDRSPRAAARAAGRAAGVPAPRACAELPVVRQVYSHFRGVYRPFLWEVAVGGTRECEREGYAWVDRAGLESRALPGAIRKITDEVATARL
jgi:A/G-specific adenine glycosylase